MVRWCRPAGQSTTNVPAGHPRGSITPEAQERWARIGAVQNGVLSTPPVPPDQESPTHTRQSPAGRRGILFRRTKALAESPASPALLAGFGVLVACPSVPLRPNILIYIEYIMLIYLCTSAGDAGDHRETLKRSTKVPGMPGIASPSAKSAANSGAFTLKNPRRLCRGLPGIAGDASRSLPVADRPRQALSISSETDRTIVTTDGRCSPLTM